MSARHYPADMVQPLLPAWLQASSSYSRSRTTRVLLRTSSGGTQRDTLGRTLKAS